jgi:hypothetical protein
MLPIVEFDGRSWFVDQRLKEFRGVWNPHKQVRFSFRSWRPDTERPGCTVVPISTGQFEAIGAASAVRGFGRTAE